MKHGKRLLGLLLALVLVVGLLPTTALAGGNEIFVYNYEELVKALQDAKTSPYEPYIIIAAEGRKGVGFTWPTGDTTVTIDIPQNVSFSVGDPHFPYTMGTWVIPENVTIIQKHDVSINTPVRVDGAWEMQRPQVGQSPKLWGSSSLTVNGSMVLQGMADCDIHLQTGCQTLVQEGFGFTGILELQDSVVLQKPEKGWSNLSVNGGTLQGPAEGRATIQMSINAINGWKYDENFHQYQIFPKLTGNLALIDNSSISILSGTVEDPVVLTCEGGTMDLSFIDLDDNTTLNIAQGAKVKAIVKGVTPYINPQTDEHGTEVHENAKVQIDGQLTLREQQNEFYNVTIGETGVLDIPADASLQWWPERCTTGHIYGTGTIHAHEKTEHWGTQHGGVDICSNRQETQNGYTQETIRLLEDYTGCAEERAKHIDSTITIIRDWIWEKPADDMYPIVSEILDQYDQPVPNAFITLKTEDGTPVEKVHYVEGVREWYTLSVTVPEGMRVHEIRMGNDSWRITYPIRAEYEIRSDAFVDKNKAVVKVTLGPVPNPLPVAESIRLMVGDQELTDLTLDRKEPYVEAELSLAGNARLPSYECVNMQLECSLDGTTWYPFFCTGDNYSFDLGSPGYYEIGENEVYFDAMTAGYDIRCKALPLNNYYTVTSDIYSKVYHINGGAKPESSGVVKPADIAIAPAADGTSDIAIPIQLKVWDGTCMVAAYDQNGKLLSIGSKEFREEKDGVISINMDLTGYDHIKVFGLSGDRTPVCNAVEKKA